jgi:ribosomal-protein-alanine N-acetyltransferase
MPDRKTFVQIRLANPGDLPSMTRLEQQCPNAAHWTDAQYRQVFQPDARTLERLALVAETPPPVDSLLDQTEGLNSRILGFLVAHSLAPDWELENIVVAPDARRMGIGRSLLGALLSRARETNSASIFLEVRESNAPARALYEKAAFAQTGRRKAYYSQPAEDAILYRRTL